MLAFLISTAFATSLATQPLPANRPIVVIGQRIKAAEDDLKSCLARDCPADEDIDASLALAETQIVAGEYRDARETLLSALRRNKDEAKRYPIPVSDLYRANGRVAAHLGYDSDYYRSTWGIYRTLKAGLPSDTVRHYSALMEVAEMTGRTRGHDRARLYYFSIAERARRENRPDIAAIAELRSAIRHLPSGSEWQNDEIRRIANLKGSHLRAPALEAKLALVRMAYEKGDENAARIILKELAALDIKRPILIYAPSYEMMQRELTSVEGLPTLPLSRPADRMPQGTPWGTLSTTKRLAGHFEDMWIDVGFHITPEGKVADARILRSEGDLFWTAPLMASIRGRRYTPGKEADPNSYRRERYTYTSAYEAQSGTRLVERSPAARVEYFDLSPLGITAPN